MSTRHPPGRSAHVFNYDGVDQRTQYEPPELNGIDTITRYQYNRDRELTAIERPDGTQVRSLPPWVDTPKLEPSGRL